MKNNTPVGYLLIGLGLALSGWFIGHGFVSGRTADRFVTVKGVSERDVEADLGLWPLQVVANANSLEEAQATIDASLAKVRSFLSDHDLGETHLELQGVEVTDRLANPYGDPGIRGGRFVVQQKLMVAERRTYLDSSSQPSGWGVGFKRCCFELRGRVGVPPHQHSYSRASMRSSLK